MNAGKKGRYPYLVELVGDPGRKFQARFSDNRSVDFSETILIDEAMQALRAGME